MNTFMCGSGRRLELVKDLPIRHGIFPSGGLKMLQGGAMGLSVKKQRNWSMWKTHIQYKVHITVRAANQEDFKARANAEDGSYLGMGDREVENQKTPPLAPELVKDDSTSSDEPEELERKSKHFDKIQEVPAEERDRAQRMQVIDRAAAAIAAARAVIAENPRSQPSNDMMPASADISGFSSDAGQGTTWEKPINVAGPEKEIHGNITPGPDFWSWSPPSAKEGENIPATTNLQLTNSLNSEGRPVADVLEKERSSADLDIPFESRVLAETSKSPEAPWIYQSRAAPSLPPLQSLMEVTNNDTSELSTDSTIPQKEDIPDMAFETNIPQHASEVATVLDQDHEKPDYKATEGVNPDGSRWWKQTGVEHRTNGVICNWTVTRGVNSNGEIEWEEKFWEAYDDFDYKELGSEKSGRDAAGNVWREFWKEVMWQDMSSGLVHMEKFADKWAKNGANEQWQEKWWEHYDAAGHAEKWADKWCQIDLNTCLEAGHAHVWHERWGEKYDGKGSAMKYTDKWAERAEAGNKWSKWGDKWDEHFDQNSVGVRQGETWWKGATGERWNRTWGEGHDGSGWIHKYGKSSSGEHWDTHEEQDTWYEKYPHFGFRHCFENSQALRRVGKRKKPNI